MAVMIGLSGALIVGLFLTLFGIDRERSPYPVIMIVIALLYSLFAVIAGSIDALRIELVIGIAFIAAAVAGFRWSLWLVAAALAAHGLMDLVHGDLVANPGVPSWWPAFCGAYDIAAAGYLAVLILVRDRAPNRPA